MDKTQQTINSYNQNSKSYAAKKQGKLKDSLPFLKEFANLLKGKKVLEIGFGLGQDAIWLVESDYAYTGIDPVKVFSDNLKEKLNGKATIIQNDIRKISFPNDSFDGIYSMATLLHLNDNDFQKVLNNCYNWLKKDGILFITLKEGEGETTREDGRYFNYFTKKKLLSFLKEKFIVLKDSKDSPREYNIGSENWINFYLKKI